MAELQEHPLPLEPQTPEAAPARRPRRLLRVLRWVLLGLVLTPVVLTLLVVLLLQSDAFKTFAANFALDRLNPSWQGSVRVGRVEGNVFTRLAVRDVVALDASGREVARLAALELHYSLWPLLSRHVTVAEVRVVAPHFVVADESGALAIAGVFAPAAPQAAEDLRLPLDAALDAPSDAPPGAPFYIEVQAFALEGGSVRQSFGDDSATISDLSLTLAAEALVGADLDDLTVAWRDLTLSASAAGLPDALYAALGGRPDIYLTTTGQFSMTSLILASFHVTAGPHEIALVGRVPPPTAEGEPESPLDLALLTAYVDLEALTGGRPGDPEGAHVRGGARIQGAFTGTLDQIEALFGVSTRAGELTLEATAALFGEEPAASLTLLFNNATPSALLPALAPDVVGDVGLVASFKGIPLDGGQATLALTVRALKFEGLLDHELSLTATLDGQDARVALGLVAATGEHVELTATSRDVALPPSPVHVEATLRGSGIALARLSELVDGLALTGTLDELSADVAARFAEGEPSEREDGEPSEREDGEPSRDSYGLRHAAGRFAVTGGDLALSPGKPGEEVALGRLALSGAAQWDGRVVPEGDVTLEIDQLRLPDGRARRVAVELGTTREKSGAPRVRGHIEVQQAGFGDLRVDSARLPLDLRLPPEFPPAGPFELARVLPRGSLSGTVRGLRQGDLHIRETDFRLRLSGTAREVTVAGPVTARGVQLDRKGTGLAAVDGTLDATWRPAERSAAGRVRLDVRRLAVGAELRLESLVADIGLQTATQRGLPIPRGPLSTSVDFTASGLVAGPDVGLRRASGAVDLTLLDGLPYGNGKVTLSGVRLPQGRLPRMDLQLDVGRDGQARAHVWSRTDDIRADMLLAFRVPRTRRDPIEATIQRLILAHGGDGLMVLPGSSAALTPGGVLTLHALRLRGMGDLSRAQLGADVRYDPGASEVQAKIELTGIELADWERALAALLRRLAETEEEDSDDIVAVDPPVPAESEAEGELEAEGEVRVTLDRPVVTPAGEPPHQPDTTTAGLIEGHITVAGSLEEPTAQVALSIADGRFGDVTNVAGTVQGAIGEDGLQLGLYLGWDGAALGEEGRPARSTVQLHVDLPAEFNLAPSALRLHLPPDRPFLLVGEVAHFDLAVLRPVVVAAPGQAPLSGTLDGFFNVEGSLREPLGSLTLRSTDLVYRTPKQYQIDIGAALDPGLTRGRVRLLEGEAHRGLVEFEIEYNLLELVSAGEAGGLFAALRQTPFSLTLNVPRTTLAELPFVAMDDPRLGRAVFAADLRASGTQVAPSLVGQVDLVDFPVEELSLTSGLTLTTAGEALELRLHAEAGGRELFIGDVHVPDLPALFSGRAAGELLRDERLRGQVRAPNISLATLSSLSAALGGLLESIVGDGALTVNAEFAGGSEGPTASLVAALRNPRSRIAGQPPPFARSVNVTAAAGPDGVRASVLLGQGERGGHLSLEAALSVSTTALVDGTAGDFGAWPLEVSLESHRFNLRGLSSLQPDIFGPSSGELDVNLRVTGTPSAPKPSGHVIARFDELMVAVAGLRYEDVTVAFDVDPARITLRPLRIEQGRNTLDLTIELDTPTYAAADMAIRGALKTQRFRVVRRDDADVRITTDLTFGGSVARPRISGDIRVDSGRISPEMSTRRLQPIGLPRDVRIVTAEELESARLMAAETGRAEQVLPEFDIRVVIPTRFFHVSSDMLDLFLSGTVQVGTTGGRITLGGRIIVDEGTVELYGRRFVVEEESGVVFGGTTELNPRLNVRAHYPIVDVDLSPIGLVTTDGSFISVVVSGTAESPQLKLSSNPPMDESNIISVLLTDAPVGQMGAEGIGAEQQALNMFVGLATGRFASLLRGDLPIDVLRVEAGEQGLTDARLRVGKRITRDLLVLYEANFGAKEDENANQIRVQYRPSPKRSAITTSSAARPPLRGRGGNRGEAGLIACSGASRTQSHSGVHPVTTAA
jgi:autotransporter translocation and assembly factor TamB